MIDKLTFESLVTPAEAVKLAMFRTYKDVCIASEVMTEYNRLFGADSTVWSMGVVWNAGRMQGIREERAKRRDTNKC